MSVSGKYARVSWRTLAFIVFVAILLTLPPPTSVARGASSPGELGSRARMLGATIGVGTATYPAPAITGVTFPTTITLGQQAVIQVNATNGGNISRWQTIQVSFPSNPLANATSILSTDLGSASTKTNGTSWYACYSHCTVNLSYTFVEGLGLNWSINQSHYLRVGVTPTSVGSFVFYYKTVASGYYKNVGAASTWDPSSGTTDQQSEYVYSRSIMVSPVSYPSIGSFQVAPSTIAVGQVTSIATNVSGGSAPYRYSYGGLPAGCNPPSTPKFGCRPSTPGTYSINVNVTDRNGNWARASAPLTVLRSLAISQNFSNVGVNTSQWSFNSVTLQDIAKADKAAWSLNVSLGVLNLPISKSAQGLDFGLAGVQVMSGFTSNYVLTPPFVARVAVNPTSSTGGNPAFVCLSNGNATSLLCVFLASQTYIQNGTTTPVGMGGSVSLGTSYSVIFQVGFSAVRASIHPAGGSASWSGSFGSSRAQAYHLVIGSFAGIFPGELLKSSYSEQAFFASSAVAANRTWNLTVHTVSVTASGVVSNDAGVTVNLFNEYLGWNATLGSVTTNATGQATFGGLLTGEYVATASQVQPSWSIPVFADSGVIVGSPTNPTLPDVLLNLSLRVPALQRLSVSLAAFPSLGGNVPFKTSIFAIAHGGSFRYSYAWLINGAPASSNSSVLSHIFANSGVYKVNVTVRCYGSWFGQTCAGLRPASSQIAIVANQHRFNITLSPFAGQSYFQLSSPANSTAGQGILQAGNGTTTLAVNLTLSLSGIHLPTWLSSFLGISTPFYGLYVGFNSSSPVDSNSLVQLQSSQATTLDVKLPVGTPTTKHGLQLSKLNFTASPDDPNARVADIVHIIFAYLGLKEFKAPFAVALSHFLEDYGLGQLTGVSKAPLEQLTALLSNLWDLTEQFVESAIGFLAMSEITTMIRALAEPWAFADFEFDATTLLGATIKGNVWESYVVTI